MESEGDTCRGIDTVGVCTKEESFDCFRADSWLLKGLKGVTSKGLGQGPSFFCLFSG